jgi:TP901 family phage tail tape measure protein
MAVSVVDVQVNSQGAVRSLQQLNVAAKGVTATIGSLAAALGAGFALQQIIRTASEFESTLSDIGKTAGSSQKDILKLADSLKQLSMPSKTNLAPSVLAKGIQDLVAQGLKLDDAVASIETLGKVAVATNSDLTDVTKTGFQLQSALKIKPTELKETFDALAFAGKAGAFELKDMAQFMPTIASAAASLGIQGKDGAVALASMMQMVRKDAPGAAEASTRLTDALLKMTAPESVKNFKKFGVDIETVLKNAVKNGINPMDAAIKELIRVTGNDPFKLSQIFGDKEAKLALMSLMKYKEEYEKLKALAGGTAAAGTIQSDFEKSLNTFNQQLQTLANAGEILALNLGNTLLPVFTALIKEIVPLATGISNLVQGMGQIPKPVIDAAIQVGKLILQVTLVSKAIGIATGAAALLRGAFVLLNTQVLLSASAAMTGNAKMLLLAGGMNTAASRAAILRGVLTGLLNIGLITIAINMVIYGLTEFMQMRAELDRLRGIKQKGGQAAAFGGTATPQQKSAKRVVLKQIEQEQKKNKPLEAVAALSGRGKLFTGTRNDILEARKAEALAVLALPDRKPKPAKPEVPSTTGGGGVTPEGGGKGDAAAKKLEAEAKKQAEEAARLKASLGVYGIELGLKRQIYDIDNKIFVASLEKDKATQIRLKGEKELLRVNSEIAKVEFESLTPQERTAKLASLAVDKVKARRDTMQELLTLNIGMDDQAKAALETLSQEGLLLQSKLQGKEQEYQKQLLINQILKDNPTLIRSQVEAQISQNDVLKAQIKSAEELKDLYSDIGMTIKSGVIDAIQGAIDGTKSLQDVATGLLKNIANKLLDVATNFALFGTMSGTGTGGGLLGGFFKPSPTPRAKGGSVSGGTPYLVGERGPELFMPGRSGGIAPTGSFGGGTNVVVNVDATGSNVQGDDQSSKQLGVMLAAAVQKELIKQKRPGGILA